MELIESLFPRATLNRGIEKILELNGIEIPEPDYGYEHDDIIDNGWGNTYEPFLTFRHVPGDERNGQPTMCITAEWDDATSPIVSLYKQLEPFAEVAGLAIGDPGGQRFSSTEQQQYTTITTIGHEC